MRKNPVFLPFLILFLCLPLFAAGEAADLTFGFTPQKCAAYADAQRQTRLADAEAYTFLAMDGEQGGMMNTSAGWIEKSAVQALRINYLEPRTVVFTVSTQMYATGNTNHPVGERIPAGTVLTARYGMEAQQSWYIVEYNGFWGFVPRSATESISEEITVSGGSRVLALVTNACTVYAYPNGQSATKKHFPYDTAVILENRAGAFYETSLQGKTVYLNEAELQILLTEEPGSATEAWADGLLDVWSVPSEEYGKRIGTAQVTGILPIAYRMGGWCRVAFGSVEGFVREDSLSVAGSGSAGYSLQLSLSSRVLSVLDASGSVTFACRAAVGGPQTPTPEGSFSMETRTDWQYIRPGYAPYVLSFSNGLTVRGPLCWGRSSASARQDSLSQFGQALTDGCVVIPVAEAQWIFFHCPAGTALTVVP